MPYICTEINSYCCWKIGHFIEAPGYIPWTAMLW